ncbi:DUF4336 domain-containing protein [Rhodopseudomonas sp. HC1]|uniref:DUF4336 domain-containing protein n=1 Tax=Rhodopseudomonas infernalis TaxID=2897386 RepID=UPI001EE7F6B1|nr:DUF4336 domain-containing protein [Rhodopseudomonas infernalis]MCG6203632.1 DUF4336 domain-containing protein [Rhodopseudomonas infernalis]
MTSTDNVAYVPTDTLKSVADGVWIVDSGPLSAMGLSVPVRMTVVRLRSGEIWLHSPTGYSDRLRIELERLGPIAHLVAPNIAHWQFVKDWKDHYPQATTWAAPGLRSRAPVIKSGVVLDHDLGASPPAAWADQLDQLLIAGGFGVTEVAFFYRASRTLILTDFVENLEPDKLGPVARPLARLAGATAPDGMAPAHYRFAMNRRRAAVKAAAQHMLAWSPERVIFAHGRWYDSGGTERLRRSLRWLLD